VSAFDRYVSWKLAGFFLSVFDPGPSAHCGTLNIGLQAWLYFSAQAPATQVQAANNYWGSSKGPAASGPGDNAGGACDQNNSTAIVTPFSLAQFGSTVLPVMLEN
jgi:hypothetical protein